MSEEKVDVLATGDAFEARAPTPPDDSAIKAERAEAREHNLTVWQSFKTYKAAVFWSIAISFTIIMDGYDTGLLSSFYGLPAFKKQYGVYVLKTKSWTVPASWQVALSQSTTVGNFFGIFWGAFLSDRMGYRKALMVNLVLIIPLIGMTTFAPNRVVLLIGELLCGVPWGSFSTLAEAYTSEICPLTLRGYLTTYINLCWVMGRFISSGVLVGVEGITTQWGYRLPFAIQWVWPIPLLIATLLAPESPWWLVRHGRLDEAAHSLQRLAGEGSQDSRHIQDAVANMVRTDMLEQENKRSNTGTYLDCFRGVNLRRTEVSAMAWACQRLCGTPLSNYAVVFLEDAGLPSSISFAFGFANSSASFVGTCLSWLLITKLGRRPIVLGGMSAMFIMLMLIGILSVVGDHGSHGAKWGQAVLMMLFLFTYDLTIGPLAYCIVGEASSPRLRSKTVGISRNAYNLITIASGVASPYMLNVANLNWGGKTGFFWAPFCLSALTWAYFRLPEMKGRSFYELDVLFERKIIARDFVKASVGTGYGQVDYQEVVPDFERPFGA